MFELFYVKKFWSHVDKRGDLECWNWTAACQKPGKRRQLPYGICNVGKHNARGGHIHAHRFSWILHFGSIPPGLFVCHHCDNARCVNPKHLWLGTPKMNSRDAVRKGRIVFAKHQTYSADFVECVMALYNGGARQTEIAQLFNMWSGTVNRMIHHRARVLGLTAASPATRKHARERHHRLN